MTPEQKFWQLLKPHVPGHVNRIENSTGVGIPDVNFCHQGKETWIELKAGSKLRDSQMIWHFQRVLQGGRVLLIERLDDFIKISNATSSYGLYNPLLYTVKPWNWEKIEQILKG